MSSAPTSIWELVSQRAAAQDKARRTIEQASSLLGYAALLPRPGFRFETPWHIRKLAALLESVERGEIDRLMVFLPPQHGKTTLASEAFPAWYLGLHPERSVISASYSAERARDIGVKVRNAISSEEHRAAFPRCELSRDSMAADKFTLTGGGAYYAVGRGGPATGRPGHLIVLDDTLKDREEADSQAVRRALHAWFSDVMLTRQQPGTAIVIVNTRWHEEDLAGYLLERDHAKEWRVLSLPAIAEEDEAERREGDALWPERFPIEALLRIKGKSLNWPALYQQRPAAVEGEVFKRVWWGSYTVPPPFSRVIQAWDTAFKTGASSDYSACTVWGEAKDGYYLLHAWRGRVEFPELLVFARDFATRWNPNAVLVEDKASGQSLVQTLQRETRLPVLPVKVSSDKVSRASAVTPLVQAGRVKLPATAGWLEEYLDELSAFPAARHDDYTDTTSMALGWMCGREYRFEAEAVTSSRYSIGGGRVF